MRDLIFHLSSEHREELRRLLRLLLGNGVTISSLSVAISTSESNVRRFILGKAGQQPKRTQLDRVLLEWLRVNADELRAPLNKPDMASCEALFAHYRPAPQLLEALAVQKSCRDQTSKPVKRNGLERVYDLTKAFLNKAALESFANRYKGTYLTYRRSIHLDGAYVRTSHLEIRDVSSLHDGVHFHETFLGDELQVVNFGFVFPALSDVHEDIFYLLSRTGGRLELKLMVLQAVGEHDLCGTIATSTLGVPIAGAFYAKKLAGDLTVKECHKQIGIIPLNSIGDAVLRTWLDNAQAFAIDAAAS